MNIFVLDWDHSKNAAWYMRAHITKMPLEYTQLLSTAIRVLDYPDDINAPMVAYKATHINHPCSLWVRESKAHWLWLRDLSMALMDEFHWRRGKYHASSYKMLLLPTPINFKETAWLRDPPQVMPDRLRSNDTVQSYRNYYIEEKRHLVNWESRNIPDWYK